MICDLQSVSRPAKYERACTHKLVSNVLLRITTTKTSLLQSCKMRSPSDGLSPELNFSFSLYTWFHPVKTKATFTRDRFQTDPNGSSPKIGQGGPSVYAGPSWNRTGTDPKLDLLFCRPSFGSVPDRFQNGPV